MALYYYDATLVWNDAHAIMLPYYYYIVTHSFGMVPHYYDTTVLWFHIIMMPHPVVWHDAILLCCHTIITLYGMVHHYYGTIPHKYDAKLVSLDATSPPPTTIKKMQCAGGSQNN
jgi:hypothetical protein